MGISKFIEKVCVQTAVYWGSPVEDGQGGMTFADPVEIACRWDISTTVISDSQGREVVSRAIILLTQDVDEEGYLYLGELDDLDSDPDPREVQGAYSIKQFSKVSMIKSTTEFVRTAYL